MQTLKRKQIDWDSILESYGPETRVAIDKLLSENDIPESDPAALVIAALFMTQIDSNRAFSSISDTIRSGKQELSAEFSEHILKLRGLITYAEEHLIETGQQEMDKRRTELYEVIKAGIAKAVGNRHRRESRRATANSMAMIICAALSSVVSLLIGVAVTSALKTHELPSPKQAVEPGPVSNADMWAEIAESNQAQLALCLENREQLEGKCAISLPE